MVLWKHCFLCVSSTKAWGLDTCRSHVRWETPRGRYDECSSKFSLREETKVIEPVGLKTAPAQHNQETLPQRNSEVVNLTGLLITKD